MALFKVTVIQHVAMGRNLIEPGMSVEMTNFVLPNLANTKDQDTIQKLFNSKYGVDLKSLHAIHPIYMKIDKL